MANKAPGKSHREGITLVQLMDMFPDEATATQWFEKVVWNGSRCCGHCGSTRTSEVSEREADALLVLGLPLLLQRPHRNRHRALPSPAPLMGNRHLPRTDQPQEHFQHEAPSGYRGHAEDCMVHAPPHPRSVEHSQRWRAVLRPGRGRRDLHGRKARQHEQRSPQGTGRHGSRFGRQGRHRRERRTARATASSLRSSRAPTSRLCKASSSSTRPPAPPSTVTRLPPTKASPSSTRASSTASPSTCAAWHTPTASNPSGACSSALTRAPSTRCLRSTLTATSKEFAGKHNIRDMNTAAQMAAVAGGLIGKRLMYRQLIADNGLPSGARS